jgi:hypothetical protein
MSGRSFICGYAISFLITASPRQVRNAHPIIFDQDVPALSKKMIQKTLAFRTGQSGTVTASRDCAVPRSAPPAWC